jgi:hypothetical protein
MKIKNLKTAWFLGLLLFMATIITAVTGYSSSTYGANSIQQPAPPPVDYGSPALAAVPVAGYQLSPGQQILPGTTPPASLPFTYRSTITDTTGTRTTMITVSCFQKEFVTNISPTGTLTGTPTFSWTGINDPSAMYGVELSDNDGNRIWNNNDISGTSIVYTGPALIPGMTYSYLVLVEGSSTCSNQGSSFVSGRFTYR